MALHNDIGFKAFILCSLLRHVKICSCFIHKFVLVWFDYFSSLDMLMIIWETSVKLLLLSTIGASSV